MYCLDPKIWIRDAKLPGSSVWITKSCHFRGDGAFSSIQPRASAITLRLVNKGSFLIKTVDRLEPYVVSEGTIFLALPFYPIEIYETGNQQNEWKEIQISGDDALPLINEFGLSTGKSSMKVIQSKQESVESIFDDIHLKLDRRQTDPYVIIQLLYTLVSTLRYEGEFKSSENYSRSREILDITLNLLETSGSLKLNIEEIAEILNVNRSTIRRAFLKETGKTPIKFVKELRIIKAKELLIHTDLKISEIASRVGFVNEKYFIRCFREDTDCPPAKWRNLKRSIKS